MSKAELRESSLTAGTTIAGRYRIERLLGTGGMGSVYEATQLAIGRRVALKVLRPDVADDPLIEARFEREARAAASVRHPNVVVVHEFGRADDGTLFLAMELLQGDSLLVRLRRGGPVSPSEAVRIASEIAAALEAAHGAGVVHRDLKPDNVMLLADGGLKVLDFGIARILENERTAGPDADRAQLTDAQQVLGTPRYISPEAVARLPVGPAADLYALGAILFEMLTGRPVFLDKEPVILMGQHLREVPPRLRDAAPELVAPFDLEALIDRLLAKMPTERPASASEVRLRLASLDWNGKQVRDATKAHVLPAMLPPAPLVPSPSELASMPTPARTGLGVAPPPTLTPEALTFQAPPAEPAAAAWATPKRRRPILRALLHGLVLTLVVVVVGGLLVVHRMRLDEERQRLERERVQAPAPVVSTEALGPRVSDVLITVRTNAPNATVRWDGERQPALSFSVPMDGALHHLAVSAPGYATREVELVADGAHDVDVPLSRGRSRR